MITAEGAALATMLAFGGVGIIIDWFLLRFKKIGNHRDENASLQSENARLISEKRDFQYSNQTLQWKVDELQDKLSSLKRQSADTVLQKTIDRLQQELKDSNTMLGTTRQELNDLHRQHEVDIKLEREAATELRRMLSQFEHAHGIDSYRAGVRLSLEGILGSQLDAMGAIRKFLSEKLTDLIDAENEIQALMGDMQLITQIGEVPPIIFYHLDLEVYYGKLMEILNSFAMAEDANGNKVLQFENPLHDYASKFLVAYKNAKESFDNREAYRYLMQAIGAFKAAKQLEDLMSTGGDASTVEEPKDKLQGTRIKYPHWFEDNVLMNFYALLKVDRRANNEEVAKAFRLGAKQLHPDSSGSVDAEFKRLNIAKSVLQDANERSTYDHAFDIAYGGAV